MKHLMEMAILLRMFPCFGKTLLHLLAVPENLNFLPISVISSYTTNLDLTTLATPEGLKFLKGLGGPAGEQMHKDYKQILKETGVTGYPYVKAKMEGNPGEVHNIVARRVDDQELQDMEAYVFSLQAAPSPKVNEENGYAGAAYYLKLIAPVVTTLIKASRYRQC